MPSFQRIFLIVLDGVGVGAAPDAAAFGDEGSNSLAHTARTVGALVLPNLGAMGLGHITGIAGVEPCANATAWYGRLTPRGAGKDSTTGHWELMGCVVEEALPTYPDGFPSDLMARFESAIGRGTLGNRPASGTEIITELGAAHVETGRPIVYTSQDSVFQVAAHESVIPPDDLYRICETARALLTGEHAVGRVIARPFVGEPGSFHRTARRRDFSLPPPRPTVLDLLSGAGRDVYTIGKIDELFAGRGVTRSVHTRDNRDGMARTLQAAVDPRSEFVFVNLVDFDTMWGHRNDARAYALGLEEFDSFLAELLAALGAGDLLIITSDHGNDPTTPGTDHSREYVPLIVYTGAAGHTLGTGEMADVGAAVAEALGAPAPPCGTSFLSRMDGA